MASYLTEADAAHALGCSVEEVRRLGLNGTLRGFPARGVYDADCVFWLAGRLLVAGVDRLVQRESRPEGG